MVILLIQVVSILKRAFSRTIDAHVNAHRVQQERFGKFPRE